MNRTINRQQVRAKRRQRRVRARIEGTGGRPRLSVFRSNRHISAQLIDDVRGVTLAAASDRGLKVPKGKPAPDGRGRAALVGAELARQAAAKGITAAQFDRGRYRYHGLVSALADGARKGGLKF